MGRIGRTVAQRLSTHFIFLAAALQSVTAFPADASRLSIERDGVRLSIPHDYIRNRDKVASGAGVLLDFTYPDFRPASSAERASGHVIDSRYIMSDLSVSRRADYAEYMAARLERLKSPKSEMQQVSRIPDREDLPGFEIYGRVRGNRGTLLYVKQIDGKQVLADCTETVPNPGCVVSFRWQKNLHVRYFFRRHWLHDLSRLHTGLEAKLQSFVVGNDAARREK